MTGQYGYTGKVLRVDLSSRRITDIPTMDSADRFLRGRGVALKIYWDEVSPEAKAFDPENRLIFVTGPLAGLPGLAGSRWQVCGKSPAPAPEHFCYCNLGGSWGAQLKFAGYDGIVVQGQSERPVYLFIEDGVAEIRDASRLWGEGSIRVRDVLKRELGESVRVVATGPAGENRVVFASLLADDDSSGSGGLGAVMGSKRLKAIAVRGSGKVRAANPDELGEITAYLRGLKREQPWMLPTWTGTETRRKACWGCIGGCMRGIFTATDGSKGKFMCLSAIFYKRPAHAFYKQPSYEVAFYANKLCDEYGVDVTVVDAMIGWLARCHEAGILTDENTGIPISRLGSLEFIDSLVKKISLRQGFGDVLAQGIVKAADLVGSKAKELMGGVSRAGEGVNYEPRMYITSGLLYAMEPRRPIQQLHALVTLVGLWQWWYAKQQGHVSTDVLRAMARRFLGSELAVDFSTYKGKALAAKKIQDREYAKESLILCDEAWPITYVAETEDHLGDPALESRILAAVTGKEGGEEELYRVGERIWNLQRAVLAREGHRGRQSDTIPEVFFTTPLETAADNPKCIVPGKEGEVISRKGAVVEREKFEAMKDEYYRLRDWDVASGLQTRARLRELGLEDIMGDLEQRGLVV